MPPDSRPTAAQRRIGAAAAPKLVSLPDDVLIGGVGARPAYYAGWHKAMSAIGAAREVFEI